MAGKPFIVMCAPNGARKTRADHAALPVSIKEIAKCAEAVLDAGASVLHLHVRDDDGNHSLDVARYRAAIAAIRARVGDRIVIQVTSEACGIYRAGQQMAMVRELQPEAVSLALKEICPDDASLPAASEFYAWIVKRGVMAQHILYSVEETERFVGLRRNGVIAEARPFVLFVLGRYSDALLGDPHELDGFVAALDDDIEWAVCCFGHTEMQAVSLAASGNGHARVGFENNLQLPDGSVAADNAQLVRTAVDTANRPVRVLATADDVREMFG